MSMAQNKIEIRPWDAAKHQETEEDTTHLFRQSIALKPAEASFRHGLQEALRGETLPLLDCGPGSKPDWQCK
jgi:hypothetical protein